MFNSSENKATVWVRKQWDVACFVTEAAMAHLSAVLLSKIVCLMPPSELTKDQWQSYHWDTPTLEKVPFSVDEILRA